jgi:PhnB protein
VSTLTVHLVTRGPDAAAAWYGSVLGAVETSRITLPGGQVMTIELRFGDSTLAIADEFPDMGVISPLTLGGTYGALHLAVGRDGIRAAARRVLGRADRPVHRPVRAPLGRRPAPS